MDSSCEEALVTVKTVTPRRQLHLLQRLLVGGYACGVGELGGEVLQDFHLDTGVGWRSTQGAQAHHFETPPLQSAIDLMDCWGWTLGPHALERVGPVLCGPWASINQSQQFTLGRLRSICSMCADMALSMWESM